MNIVRRRGVTFLVSVCCVLGALVVPTVTHAATNPTYASVDGRFSFRYPSTVVPYRVSATSAIVEPTGQTAGTYYLVYVTKLNSDAEYFSAKQKTALKKGWQTFVTQFKADRRAAYAPTAGYPTDGITTLTSAKYPYRKGYTSTRVTINGTVYGYSIREDMYLFTKDKKNVYMVDVLYVNTNGPITTVPFASVTNILLPSFKIDSVNATSTPVKLSTVRATQGTTTETITWTTNIATTGRIDYGENKYHGVIATDSSSGLTHSVTIPVVAGITYHYAVISCAPGSSTNCAKTKDKQFTVTSATPGPVLSDIMVTQSGSYATVAWTTDLAADGIVNYGLTDQYGAYVNAYPFVTSHSLTFPVTAGNTYHYFIRTCTPNPSSVCTSTNDRTYTAIVTSSSAPVVSNILVTQSGGYAYVSWTTDVYADGIVNYGTTSAYGTYVNAYPFIKSHVLTFRITSGLTYHYFIRACTPNPGTQCTSTADATFVAQ